jgi:ribonuclease G
MSSVKRILITADPQEVRVAVVEGGKLSEAYIERRGRRSIVGNVYKGRVDAVLPGMEAAFVDIGLEKNGFLYVNEIVLPDLDERERRKMRIQELIQPGQDVLVQVTKDPMRTKGARLTMEVSLAGRFMVLVPGGDGIGISRKLPDGERDRLRDLIRPVRTQEDAGMIVRTAAEGASVPELERDVRLLEKLWEVTRGHAERAEAPALVYAEPDLSLQVIRDDLRADVSEVVIDDERQYHRILAYVNRTSPELAERIKLYRGKRALFQRYEIEQGIRSTLKRRVDLPSGGSLIFDYAEAFTIVDVNTGRFTGKKRLEDTILKNNLEAAVEVVRQLRLRDVGGIIVIDFIDMAAQKNRDAVLKTIQKELERDRSKSYVVEISPLGLVEMTRHNVTDGVREILTVACRHCEGTGRVLSPESIVIDDLRELRRITRESKSEAFRIGVAPEIVPALCGPAGSTLLELENETGRWFEVEPLLGIAPTQLEVLAEGTRGEIVRESPLSEGAELTVRIGEPHPFVETDAVAWLESGYAITVHGALPYVGKEQRIQIERALRFSAEARLLDAEPALAEPIDRESDLLEPARRVGERLDVEGKTRGRRRRGTPKSTSNGEHVDPMSIEEAIEGGAPDYGDDPPETPLPPVAATHERRRSQSPEDDELEGSDDEPETAETNGSGDPTTPRRRRRRGGRGRSRRPAGADALVEGDGSPVDDDFHADDSAEPEADEVADAVADDAPEGEPGGDEPTGDGPARRRRRRGGRGRGGRGGAANGASAETNGDGESGDAVAATAGPRPARAPRAPRAPRPAVAAEGETATAEPRPRTPRPPRPPRTAAAREAAAATTATPAADPAPAPASAPAPAAATPQEQPEGGIVGRLFRRRRT